MTRSLPPAFETRMRQWLGHEAEAFLHTIADTPPSISMRLNPRKTNHQLPDSLAHLDMGSVAWCPDGHLLTERPTFTLDPCFQGGGYYVQEAASMFVGHVVRQLTGDTPVKALDLCAAPGGKSTHILACLPEGSLLVANETIRSRASILKENIVRWGYPDVVVTNNDPADFSSFEGVFDLLVVDAPCSGEGMFRKDPTAIREWSESNLALCAARQRRILTDSWHALRPGGYLIYSTCTYNPDENEEIIDWLCDEFHAESVPIPLPDAGIRQGRSDHACVRFYPHLTSGEGFFCGVVRKTDGKDTHESRPKRQKNVSCPIPPEVRRWLHGGDYAATGEENRITMFPAAHSDFIRQLRSRLHVIQFGCEVAELFGHKVKPLHPLAVSTLLNRDHCLSCDVDTQTAIRYMKREDIQADAPIGEWTLITSHGTALGWGKNLGTRFNNYFPKELVIRMS